MAIKSKLLPALLLSIAAGVISTPAMAAKCPIDERKSRAVSERVGKKVQKAYELYSNEQVDQALQILLEIKTSSDFDKAYVARMIGSLYAGKDGKVDTAMKHLKVAVDINQLGGSDHANALKLIADLSISERKFDDALSYYNQWMDFTCKEDVNVYLRMASAYYEKKQYPQAISFADKSIAMQTKPNKAPFSLKMGAYYETKQYKNAAKMAEEIVRNFPQDGRSWVQLAQMYMLSEDYKKSLYTMDVAYRNGYLEKASEYKMLAQLYAQNDIPLQSAKIQEKYLKDGMVERDVNTVAMLANTYHQAKEIDKAVTYYGEAGKMSNNAKHYMRQAGLLMEKERYQEAKAAIRSAMDGTGLKSIGEAQMLLAQAHFYLGEFKSAYKACFAATKDSKTAKNAKSWLTYIEDTAKRNKVSVR
ncbi:tetratricopeptide repeat protein [Ferrimonas senticii]|uniref:tetratricopeptide repeat protein n=1 Tax=Ferrimonas senticii TaxID=394566 RepID=UPI0004137CEE|nr:tetratricopeptide repeat protein [Ferrimonas senticii]